MPSIILGFVVLVLAVVVASLYRDVVLLGQRSDAGSRWPLAELAVGHDVSDLFSLPTRFVGFVTLCSDDSDGLGAAFSTAVIAAEWGHPLVVVIGETAEPNGWTSRLVELPGSVEQTEVAFSELRSLKPLRLPVTLFVQDGRVLDGTAALDAPSMVANRFEHVASTIDAENVRTALWT